MTDADRMVDITQCKFKEFVGEDGGSVSEPKKGVIGEDGSQTHCAGVEDGFATEAAETRMAMNNLNLLSNDNVAEDGEEGEDGGEGSFAVDNEERNMIDLQSIGEVSDSGTSFVCMGNNNDFVSPVDEFLRGN